MTPEQLRSVQQAAEEIRSWQRLRYVWWLQTHYPESNDLQKEENQSTWELTLAPLLERVVQETGLSAPEVLRGVSSWLEQLDKAS